MTKTGLGNDMIQRLYWIAVEGDDAWIVHNGPEQWPSIDEIDSIIRELTAIKDKGEDWIELRNLRARYEEEEWMMGRGRRDKESPKEPKRGFLYLIRSGDYYKVGRSFKPQDRIKKYITENPNEVEVVAQVETDYYDLKEKDILEKFKKHKHRGEWFRFDDATLEEVIKHFKECEIQH